ncbi:MAG: universal stress protein [Bacteroidetes bacterium]|nr:MAG: universal stress protein [Bacteroidota bacterium]
MLRTHHLLLPTDLKDPDLLLRMLRLALHFEGELHVFHVAHRAPIRPAWNRNALRQWLLAELDGETGPRGALPARLHVHQEVVGQEVIHREIARFAERHEIDLIVAGTSSDALATSRITPETVAEVVRHAPCPVVTLPPAVREQAPIRHLLVPTDFSDCSQHALAHAKALAHRFGARITLVHVLSLPPMFLEDPAPAEVPVRIFSRQPEQYLRPLRALYEQVPGPAVPCDVQVSIGPVPDRIAGLAAELHADLIVLGSHGATGFHHLPLGNVADRVIRTAPVPVLTVKSFGRSLLPYRPASFRHVWTSRLADGYLFEPAPPGDDTRSAARPTNLPARAVSAT